MRITTRDIERALDAYRTALERAGISSYRLYIVPGSPTYGTDWHLYRSWPDDQSPPPVGPSRLGSSKLEAFQSLADRAALIFDVLAEMDTQL